VFMLQILRINFHKSLLINICSAPRSENQVIICLEIIQASHFDRVMKDDRFVKLTIHQDIVLVNKARKSKDNRLVLYKIIS